MKKYMVVAAAAILRYHLEAKYRALDVPRPSRKDRQSFAIMVRRLATKKKINPTLKPVLINRYKWLSTLIHAER